MKDKIGFDYDSYTDNMYVTLARFKHKTTGTISELLPGIHAMIDLEKDRVIGLLITNYTDISATFFKSKNKQTSIILFNSRTYKVASLLDSYYEDKDSTAPINEINRSIKRALRAA